MQLKYCYKLTLSFGGVANLPALRARNVFACHDALRANLLTCKPSLCAYSLPANKPYVLTCLRAHMVTYKGVLHAYVLMCQPSLCTCLPVNEPCLLTCQCALRTHVSTCLVCLRSYMPKCLTCSQADMPVCLECLSTSLIDVPCILR